MKRLTLILGLLLSMSSLGFATEKQVVLEYKKTQHDNSQSPIKVHRAPERFPDISAAYNSDTCLVEVGCSDSIEAEVFLYDMTGDLIDYSSTVNTTLSAFEVNSNFFTIYIEGENWSATAIIEP